MWSLDDWVASATDCPAVQTYAPLLLAQGISAMTFQRDSDRLIADLMALEIPRLAAAEVVESAMRFAEKIKMRQEQPMGIFWDVENVGLPPSLSGRDAVRLMREKFSLFGNIMAGSFKAYFAANQNCIPIEKNRSELQLSGCTIIDTPHLGRKEVADKMIIVDALMFAFAHKDTGAAIVIITGDTDFTYTLATLRTFPKIRTVLVSQGRMAPVLGQAAHVVLRWETDVLALSPAAPRHVAVAVPVADAPVQGGPVPVADAPLRVLQPIYDGDDDSPVIVDILRLDILTPQETMNDDIGLLRQILAEAHAIGKRQPLKSWVGLKLQSRNPLRFATKESRSRVFESGLLVSGGPQGSEWVMLRDPESSATTPIAAMLADPFLDAALPSADKIIAAMTEAAKEIVRVRRFVVFIPPEIDLPATLPAPGRFLARLGRACPGTLVMCTTRDGIARMREEFVDHEIARKMFVVDLSSAVPPRRMQPLPPPAPLT